jgi:FKBP-type peptidyl-prolyl cis-trans isomerase
MTEIRAFWITLLLLLASSVCSCRSTPKGDAARAAPSQAASKSAPGSPPPEARREPSGLVTQVLAPGKGARQPGGHDTVRVHFTGWNEKGKRFEDTREHGHVVRFLDHLSPKTLFGYIYNIGC